jgi:hypothetical protein
MHSSITRSAIEKSLILLVGAVREQKADVGSPAGGAPAAWETRRIRYELYPGFEAKAPYQCLR